MKQRTVWMISAGAALVMAAVPADGQGGSEPLTVVAVRFYSPARGTTTIDGVCELHLDAVASGPGPTVRYRVEVSVRDSTGLELQRNGWTREVPVAVARAPGATAVETFDFPAEPGRYQVVVRAIPETGAAVEQAVTVAAYHARPPISDLLLGTAARQAVTDTGAVGAGEIRRGSLVMQTAPVPRLTPGTPTLRYYAEVYPWQGASLEGQLSVAVLGSGGRALTRTTPRAVRFQQAGGVTEGSLDLTGLPDGEYQLQLSVRLGDSTLVEAAPFRMAPEAVAAAQAAAPAGPPNPFAGLSEAQLDSMYAPLVYLLKPQEQGVYDRLALEGKRRFLEQFWAARNAAPGGAAANQAMVRFYRAVDYANRTFKEGGAGQIPGWRTDRGRIYLRNGGWDEILRRPMASPAPYQVWKYTRGRPRYYVFVDRSGLGNYQLVATNDRNETGLPDWGQMMGVEDSTDVARFLGYANQGMQ
jgi:GWxTD domain-containing protein